MAMHYGIIQPIAPNVEQELTYWGINTEETGDIVQMPVVKRHGGADILGTNPAHLQK